MKRSLSRYLFIFALASALMLGMTLLIGIHPASALPEYAHRTGETCATCHVNPGGGGPRTLRGLLWGARGRPDKVPSLPGILVAPGVSDGTELYEIACGGCHGGKGEGLFASGLTGTGIGTNSIRSFVQRGILVLGMPSFEGQFTEPQLEALVTYVSGLASGEIPPPSDVYPLPAALFSCMSAVPPMGCQKTAPEKGGN